MPEGMIISLVIEATVKLGSLLVDALRTGDHSMLSRPISEILPHDLRTELALRRTRAEAVERLGPKP